MMAMSNQADVPEILRRPAASSSAGSRVAALLGGAETVSYISMTLGELVYDRVSIDVKALEAFEFVHKPAVGDIHNLATWAHTTLDGIHGTDEGRFIRLQGYVFESMAAAALRQSGAVVELPESATNPGWDLRINGEEVQAKCGLSPRLVQEHFERYPDVRRVVVNEELASHFLHDDRVLVVGGITRDLVRNQTDRSLNAAADMLDISMIQFAPALSVIRNGWALWKRNTDLQGATGNVAIDGSARLAGAMAGKAVGLAAAAALGGWPAILAPVFASAVGYRSGRAVAGIVKRHVLLRAEATILEEAVGTWCAGCARVLGTMMDQAAASGRRFRSARARAEAAWVPLIDDWLQRLEAEQAYRRLHQKRFERATSDLNALGGRMGLQGAASAALLAASRAGLLPSDLSSERKVLLAAAETYSRGLQRRLLS